MNFYPDVGMFTHGKLLPQTIPLYDFIFTTKSFGRSDLLTRFGFASSEFIEHGFDPEIHRPLVLSASDWERYGCDVSFIGTWSAQKEFYLASLLESIPSLRLRIWGSRWEKSRSKVLDRTIESCEVYGDLYVHAIGASAINLGLLSEQVTGASSGDLITARTFHIPGAGGFMLHQYSDEATKYFVPDEEAVFFKDAAELTAKVSYFLGNPADRERIRSAGHLKAIRAHSLDERALRVLKTCSSLVAAK